jgi:uncharacterized protein (TIGR01568 family)
MAKLRFRLRISRVIPSFNCRSKHSTTTATSNHSSYTPTSYNLSPLNHRRRRQPPIVSNSGNCCSRNLHHHHIPRPPSSSGGEADAEADNIPLARGIRSSYLWTKSEKWHIVCCESSETEISPSSSPPRSKIDSDLFAWRHPRCTRGSDSSGDDSGWFSTDEEYGYENNGTCKSFSTAKGATERNYVAVSKVSADPRGDFRKSMAEMVEQRGIYDVEGLRRLLHCFLSLNDQRHRQAILAAFADVWYAIFPSVALAAIFPNMFYKC